MSLRIVKLVFCSNRNREEKKIERKKHHCQRKSRICVVFLLAFEHFHNLLGLFCCLCGFICVFILFCSVFALKNDKSLCKQRDFKCLQFLWLAIHTAFSFVYIGNKSAVSAKWIHMKRAYCLPEKKVLSSSLIAENKNNSTKMLITANKWNMQCTASNECNSPIKRNNCWRKKKFR